MKNFRKHSKKIALVLLSSFIFVNCSQQDDNINTSNKDNNSILQRSGQIYTGEELFKSIFFGQGEFAKNISMYEDITNQYEQGGMVKESLFLERFDTFVQKVTNTNPTFFNDFQTNINSGNPLVIQESLKTGYSKIYDHMDTLFPELLQVIDSFDGNSEVQAILSKEESQITVEEQQFLTSKAQEYMALVSPCGPLFCVAYFALAVHNTAALTANIYVYLGYKLWGPKLDSYKGGKNVSFERTADNLKFEVLINDIVTAVK